MRHVDALSRAAFINVVRDALTERLSRAQQQDEKIATIRTLLLAGPYKDYVLKHGLVYKGEEGQEKLVIPKGLQQEVIRRAHEVGHFSTKKTTELLAREYWMERMEQKVEAFIQNCLPCILGARKRGRAEGMLNPIPKDDTPLHTVHMDHIGPLPSTRKQYKHLLVLVDGFTKYLWIFATKSMSTAEVIEKLRIMQQHFGNPQRFVTDCLHVPRVQRVLPGGEHPASAHNGRSP